MRLTINSKKLHQSVTFSRPGGGYVFIDMSGDDSRPGSLGLQICDGGKTIGNTITYSGENQAEFERICRNWLRGYYRNS